MLISIKLQTSYDGKGVPAALSTFTTEDDDNHTWCRFEGRTISFALFARSIATLALELRQKAMIPLDPSEEVNLVANADPERICVVNLDVSDIVAGCPEGFEDGVQNEGGERSAWLSSHFPHDDLVLLGLASYPGQAFGLLLLRDRTYAHGKVGVRWRRLGYCDWTMISTWTLMNSADYYALPGVLESLEARYGDLLRCKSEEWAHAEGLFG